MPLKRGRSTAVNLATFMSFIASRRTCKCVCECELHMRGKRGRRKESDKSYRHIAGTKLATWLIIR